MTCQVVLKTLQHKWAAMFGLSSFNLFQRHPQGAVNIPVQFLFRIMLGDLAAKTIADIGFVLEWMHPAIDADQCLGLKLPGCFLVRFPNNSLNQAFVWLEMSGGLVECHFAVDFFLDQ